MKREEFKFLAAGQYAYQKRETTIDKVGLDIYVEGALFGYDMAFKILSRTNQETEKPLPKPTVTIGENGLIEAIDC